MAMIAVRNVFGCRTHTAVRATWSALLLVVSLIHSSPASAEPRLFDDFVVTSWTEDDGLYGGWIVGLAQDRRGYLWIGTVSGLMRFDGLNFVRFEGTEKTRLPRRSVSTVYGATDGSIWVGFSGGGGIYQIRDREIHEFGATEGLGDARTSGFLEDLDGSMFAATPEGLYRFTNHRWQRLGAESGLPDGAVTALYLDRSGRVWVAHAAGLLRRDKSDGVFTHVQSLAFSSLSIGETPSGAMLTAHPSKGYSPLTAVMDAADSSAPAGSGYRLLVDRAGNHWLATSGQGLWYQRGGAGNVTVLRGTDGLSSDSVRVVYEDRNGNIWVGTTAGLHRFSRRRVDSVNDLGMVAALAAGANGDVWVGTGNGLVRFSGATRRRYTDADGLPDSAVRGLYMDPQGRLWISTATGIATWENDRFLRVPMLNSKALPVGPTTMATDRAGNLWMSTEDHGLFRMIDGRLEPFPVKAGGANAAVHTVFADRDRNVWLTLAGGGLAGIEPTGQVSLLRASDKFHRSDLAVNDDGSSAWFGAGDRLTRLRNGRLDEVTVQHGLPADAIRAIVADRDGHLWIGNSAGIIRLTTAEIDRVVAGDPRPLEYRSYSSFDGLMGVPVRVGLPNAVRASDGRLWFVTGHGVTVIDPRQLAEARAELPIEIERVTANGRALLPPLSATLPPRTTSLQIDYTAMEYASPRQVQFRYRLVGLSDEWTDAGSRRQALFTNLPPGDYRFEVLARSSEGVWSKSPATMAIGIEPTFYQTRWFAALVAGLVLVGAWALYQRRRQQLRRQFELVLNERARMAREIHDTLLQSLAGLELQMDAMASQVDSDATGVKAQLDRVRRQIQSDVTEARQSIFGLRSPTLESRDLAGALRDVGASLAEVNGVRFEATVTGTPRISNRVEEHLLRVGREAISNAMRHAQARVVTLELHYTADAITLRVSDDGCGFDIEEPPAVDARHWGLASMRERAAAIGGRFTLVSRPGAGTNLEIVAPLSPSQS